MADSPTVMDKMFDCKEQSAPATIPWIPTPKSRINISFGAELDRMLEQTVEENYDHHGKRHILATFARAFPFYLAGRYHQMSGVQIFNATRTKGNYWTNAGHFIHLLSDYATIPYYNCMQGVTFNGKIQGGSDLCTTAAEFLLEPWVLMQLPFQPALLHQWAVAALAETHLYRKKLHEIGYRRYAPQFNELFLSLHHLSCVLLVNCEDMLSYFFLIYCTNPEESIVIKAKKMFPHFPKQLALILTHLEFVLGKRCAEILNVIKQKSWNRIDLVEPNLNDFFCETSNAETYIHVYSSMYWKVKCDGGMKLCTKLKRMGMVTIESNLRATKMPNEKYHEQFVKIFTRDFILKAGNLKMKNQEQFIDELESYMPGGNLYQCKIAVIDYLLAYAKNNTPAKAEQGIVHQLLSLQADVEATQYLGLVTYHVWRAAKSFDKDAYVDFQDLPPLPLEFSVKGYLEEINSLQNHTEKWSVDQIFERASRSIDADKIVDADFTPDIRRQVLSQHVQYFKALQGVEPFAYHVECSVLQYIVPCFIAMMMDVSKTVDANDEWDKLETLVYSLIKSYRVNGDCCSPENNIRNIPFHFRITENEPSSQLRRIIEFFKQLGFPDHAVSSLSHLWDLSWSKEIVPKNHPEPFLFIPTVSEVLISKFCSRIRYFLGIQLDCSQDNDATQGAKTLMSVLAFLATENPHLKTVVQLRLKQGYLDQELMKTRKFKVKLKDSRSLTDHQLCGILLYDVRMANQDCCVACSSGSSTDPIGSIAIKVLSKKWLDVVTALSTTLKEAHLTQIPFELAEKNSCYQSILKKTLTKDWKVPLESPGQVTFFPVKHCRWCGLVKTSQFRLCPYCRDDPEYYHWNFFCSEKCETEALETFHAEEHAAFVIEKLGI